MRLWQVSRQNTTLWNSSEQKISFLIFHLSRRTWRPHQRGSSGCNKPRAHPPYSLLARPITNHMCLPRLPGETGGMCHPWNTSLAMLLIKTGCGCVCGEEVCVWGVGGVPLTHSHLLCQRNCADILVFWNITFFLNTFPVAAMYQFQPALVHSDALYASILQQLLCLYDCFIVGCVFLYVHQKVAPSVLPFAWLAVMIKIWSNTTSLCCFNPASPLCFSPFPCQTGATSSKAALKHSLVKAHTILLKAVRFKPSQREEGKGKWSFCRTWSC